jgi:hypothetical protein
MNRKSTCQSGIQRGGGRCKAAISAGEEWAGEPGGEQGPTSIDPSVAGHGDATVTRAQGIANRPTIEDRQSPPYLLSETGRGLKQVFHPIVITVGFVFSETS